MTETHLLLKSQNYLDILCNRFKERSVGSSGNRLATHFFEKELSVLGWETKMSEFDAVDWEGIQWPQGDHSIFLQFGVPAMAVSSKWFIDNINGQEITHTPKDNTGIVDCSKLVEISHVLNTLIRSL